MKSLRICILAQLSQDVVSWLNTHHRVFFWNETKVSPPQSFLKAVDIIVLRSPYKLTKESLRETNSIKAVIRAGSGIDNIDPELFELNIPIITTPVATESVAEHAIGLLLAAARQTVYMHTRLEHGQWEKSRAVGIELMCKTALIVGFGRIGRRVSEIASVLFGELLICDPTPRKPEKVDQLSKLTKARLVDFDYGIEKAHAIILCCSPAVDSSPLLSRKALSRIQDNAIIVNVGRGSLIDESALIHHLEQGRLRVGIDTFQNEPNIPKHFFSCADVTATPHIGAQTDEAHRRVGTCVRKIIEEIANGAQYPFESL